jgi:hypothetical protein
MHDLDSISKSHFPMDSALPNMMWELDELVEAGVAVDRAMAVEGCRSSLQDWFVIADADAGVGTAAVACIKIC